MPLYEYQCRKCQRRVEKIENVKGPHLKKCPHCGGKVEPLLSAPAIQFKGSGWYVTDYARKGSAGDGAKSEKTETPAKSDGSDSRSAASKKEDKKAGSASKEK